ncbi:uncharacterized protein LOC132545123 [Ylistrum balloti]|uniref:uncharacterized protein LOC132545123 n=1 Tax=Ylistrum balloti TaxID=509963 RepID=UPI002905BBCC|nr:uncharacterized protein LOC132545123 [Ylistrum balloti]
MAINVSYIGVGMAVVSVITAMTPVPVSPYQCESDSDCNPDQCCSKIPRIMAVSRRQLAPIPDLQYIVRSSCKPYIPTNGSCVNVIKVNGDCGCAPDHTCKHFPELDQLNPFPGKRDFFPGNPLSYQCVMKTV